MEKPKLHVPKERPLSAFSKANSDIVSYEDLIVSQYLDDLKRSRQEHSKIKEIPLSPYSQRFPNYTFSTRRTRRRPVSASIVGRSRVTGKPKIDLKYIADHSLWDPATPRPIKHTRPSSAPIKHHKRPQSATSSVYSYSGRMRPPSGRSKPLYKKQPHIIRVSAYKNGCKDTPVRGAAPSIKMLLEFLTDRLALPFAGRRIFLEDGIEIFEACDIPPYSEVYISMGEPYKDPDEPAKRNLIQRNGATWRLTGVNLPQEGKKKTTKAKISKRMRSLIDKKKVRILVFRNGNGNEPTEVVADLSDRENFLEGCTGRLDLTSHARNLYDWDGNDITDLNDTPMLDDCLQTGGTPVLGPLWVSLGDGFSPSGAREFITQLIQIMKRKLKQAKLYKAEIESALNDESVNDKYIKSMSPDELYEAQSKAETDVDQYKDILQKLKGRLEGLEEQHQQEEAYGAKYRMTHIQEISSDSRIVGPKGLRLKVYENGRNEGEHIFFFNLREAMKGINTNADLLMKRLLDELSCSHWTNHTQAPKLNAVAQKIFDKFGHDITNVMKLEYDQEIWLSFGEAFITPFTYCLAVAFDRAKKLDHEGVDHVVRESAMTEQTSEKEDTSQWESTIGFPMLYEPGTQSLYPDPNRDKWLIDNAELDSRDHYMIHKEKREIVLYPEVTADEKIKRGHKENQIWIISKTGYIYSKYFPQICLGVSDTRIEGKIFEKEVMFEGHMVMLQKRQAQNPNQIWTFNIDGTITPQSHTGMNLTYIGSKFGDDESYDNNKPTGGMSGIRVCLIVSEPLPKKDASNQRFAIKQEKFDNLGQWKFTEASNPDYNKLAYSWPVKENGDINEKYNWPMEGFIIPNAPPIRKSQPRGYVPLRLLALKNGERDTSNAVSVVAPNMTNMMKDHKKNRSDTKCKNNRAEEDNDTIDIDFQLHCTDLTLHELEFTRFLDSCTSLLNLPFAGRRLFDESGEEHFTLKTIERDQIVYISCGENWTDPKLTKEEQQKRFVLSQLTHDVAKIKQFCALRNPEKFVMEIEGLTANSCVIINKEWNKAEDLRLSVSQSMEEKPENLEPPEENDVDLEQDLTQLTARERACINSDKRLNALKWPWERLVNVTESYDYEDPEAKKYSDKDMYEKYKPKPSPRLPKDVLQTFLYEDGYIASTTNRNLVIGVTEQEGRVSEVLLVKRMPDDINQKWVMTQHGEIRSKFNQQLVLTVSMPSLENTGGVRPMSFSGCPITLQSRRTNQFGKAHQRWHYDAESGLIRSFYSELPDKEITAANQADVCTYAIAQSVQIDQPGYLAEIPLKTNNNNKSNVMEIKVCISCARAMRGRYKLTKLKPNSPFSCAMGTAKKLRLKQIGSFRILNGKVDLSTHEAEITLQKWIQNLEVLKKEASATTIAKEISAAKTVKNVKILAYKNGEGRLRPGEIICGSSIQGLLNQCMSRLGLNNAARRLYTEDGLIMLDICDLIEYTVENYKNSMVDKLEKMMVDNGDLQDVDKEDDMNMIQDRGYIEVNDQLQRAMEHLEQDEEDERGDSERGETEEQQENETVYGQDLTDAETLGGKQAVDDKEAEKIRKRRDFLLSQINLPTLDCILRYPIEIWVSSGKAFVPPEVVESKEVNRKKRRAFRAQVSLELDMEKHVLRQMKGRRIESQKPGEYKSTLNTKQPVVKEGNWEQPTVEEQIKNDTVNKLESHLNEIRNNQKTGSNATLNVRSTRKLYHTPSMKRVLVYCNGESSERATYISGADMTELLENATSKLDLWKKAKLIYSEDGTLIKEFDDITRDQLLCISTGKKFKPPKICSQDIEVKANWGRARKQYGPEATDLRVYPNKNERVDVDPFGPPELALPVTIGETEDKPRRKKNLIL